MTNREKLFYHYLTVAFVVTVLMGGFSTRLYAQEAGGNVSEKITLDQCITYALDNQPVLKKAKLGQEISEKEVKIALSGWLPQVNANFDLQHFLKQPVTLLPDFTDPSGPRQEVTMGVKNTSTLGISATQILYGNDVMLAGKTAKDYRLEASQQIESVKIDVVVSVSKAYYQVLITQQRLELLDENIQRLEKNLRDAQSRYESGLADNIDYKRATIALNSAKVEKITAVESLKVQYASLKQLMGYPSEQSLEVSMDVNAMETAVPLKENQQTTDFSNRIEYKLLQTNKRLVNASVQYYNRDFLPTVSAFVNYNWAYQNDEFAKLYNRNFPNSVVGLKATVPLFTGLRRLRNVQKSKLQYMQLESEEENLVNQMNTEHVQAMATYRSALEAYQTSKENYELAQEVYETVQLQYNQGIKAYLEVIVSETDLRSSQLNYLNALLNVLSSKLDVQKALGTVPVS
ncbi:TolC family protein [Rapidithrix thailandica]|uniref:TolC family protein n=1 Tax=Rapidithrix thailandica TaxID=413964 RepID=A0AAW9S472_9BACT